MPHSQPSGNESRARHAVELLPPVNPLGTEEPLANTMAAVGSSPTPACGASAPAWITVGELARHLDTSPTFNPLGHLTLPTESARLLANLLPAMLTRLAGGSIRVDGFYDITTALLAQLPPDAVVPVMWRDPDSPPLRLCLSTLLRKPDFPDQLARMTQMWATLFGSKPAKQRELARKLDVAESKISKAMQHDRA